uniref:VRK serine/threonine kinase 3 n=1 Tax=Tetraodon nigroviridis TaxID=99883 RepID=H3CV98_TETNG
MAFHFCPQCGAKLQPGFKFCPSCGERLPCPHDRLLPVKMAASLGSSAPEKDGPSKTSPALSPHHQPTQEQSTFTAFVVQYYSNCVCDCNAGELSHRPTGQTCTASSQVTSQSPRRQTRHSPRLAKKRAKSTSAVAPLQDGQMLTDTTGKKWSPAQLLRQSTTELIYEVARAGAKESGHILKLGAKDGKIFNEQNFLQRAAKPSSVEKWIKQHKMDFLGIPSCVGFGLHADSYRFLIFSDVGRSLQSVMEEEKMLLSETAVLQLACRILDALHYIHTNEYVHADINAENIYIQQGDKSQVFLVGYHHAFRFCPGGQHVEYREHSRTPHEGATEFISLDMHKGAAPSRRSDLQSLAYCMLHWSTGTLPWAGFAQPGKIAAEKQRYMGDVPALLGDCFRTGTVPRAFETYVSAVMALQYTEVPDYGALRDGLSQGLRQQGGSLEQPLSCVQLVP